MSGRGDGCRSCGADVIWCLTVNDRLMPVDVDPHPDGTVKVTDRAVSTSRGRYRRAEVLGPLEVHAHDGPLHRSHFATCKHADRWRR